MKSELDQLVAVMNRAFGRDISAHDESLLAQALENRRAATGLLETAQYLDYLAERRTEAGEFCHLLNNTYSEFFRNPLAFDMLEHLILPRLVE
jgi:chemotaxis protein methyltransferase CheR